MEDQVDISSTLGVAFIGYLGSLVLFSCSTAQVVVYLRSERSTKRPLTRIILWLLVLDLLQVSLVTHALYFYLVQSRNDPNALRKPNWSIVAMTIPSIGTIGTVQYIWIMRIWTLNRHNWRTAIAYIMLFFLLLDGSTSLTWAIQSFKYQNFADIIAHRLWLTVIVISLITFNDFLQTSYFCYLLHQSRDGLGSTDSLINTLILYGMNTGIATCVASVALLLSMIMAPTRFYYMAIYWILQKLYVNCLMAMLNRRTPRVIRPADRRAEHIPPLTDSHLFTTVFLDTMSLYTRFPEED